MVSLIATRVWKEKQCIKVNSLVFTPTTTTTKGLELQLLEKETRYRTKGMLKAGLFPGYGFSLSI